MAGAGGSRRTAEEGTWRKGLGPDHPGPAIHSKELSLFILREAAGVFLNKGVTCWAFHFRKSPLVLLGSTITGARLDTGDQIGGCLNHSRQRQKT